MIPLWPVNNTLNTTSLDSIGPILIANGLGVFVSGLWAVTNTAIFVPFWLSEPTTITKVFIFNGSTVLGSVDAGLYDQDGNTIFTAGSSTQTGTNVPQAFTVSNVTIGPGKFYLAAAVNQSQGAGASFFRQLWTTTTLGSMAGMAQKGSGFPLPTSSVSFDPMTTTYIPLIGLATRGIM